MPFDGPEVSSSFQKRPAYRYLRRSDHLPRYDQIPDIPLSRIDAKVKLFNPTGIGTWYVAAYDPEDRIAWGLADLHEREIGSFSMQELVDFRGRFGLPIERDLHWSPKSLATLLAGGGRYRVAQARVPGSPTHLSVPPMPHTHQFHLPNHGFASTAALRQHVTEVHRIPETKSRYAEGMRHMDAHKATLGGQERSRIPGVTTDSPGWTIPGVTGSLASRSSRPRYRNR